MTTHDDHAHMNGSGHGPRLDALEEWRTDFEVRQKAREVLLEEKTFNLFGEIMTVLSVVKSSAESASKTSTLVAAQFHAVHGDVAVMQKDFDAVDRARAIADARLTALETWRQELDNAPTSEHPSFNDLDNVARDAIMQSSQESKRIAEAVARQIAEEVGKRHRLEADLQHSNEERAKAEQALATRDAHAHDYTKIVVTKALAIPGAIIIALVTFVWYLLTHGGHL